MLLPLTSWKRRDIHEKRAARNFKIESIKAEIKTNDILLPRLRTITEEVHSSSDGSAQFSRVVEQLKTNPSPDAPEAGPDAGQGPGAKRLTYDEMVLSLLLKVYDDAREKGVTKGSGNEERLQEALVQNLKEHITKLGERQQTIQKELEKEERERTKKITSESMHDGFDASVRSSFASFTCTRITTVRSMLQAPKMNRNLCSARKERSRHRRLQTSKCSTPRVSRTPRPPSSPRISHPPGHPRAPHPVSTTTTTTTMPRRYRK